MSSLSIGVDPGKTGAIAFIPSVGEPWTVRFDKVTPHELVQSVEDALSEDYDEVFAILEHVHSTPQMGVKSAFSFGQSYGSLEMLLTAHRIPFERVRPQKWQKLMGCLTKGNKNVSKRRAQELFPNIKVVHANADALLLAEFCRRIDWAPNDLGEDTQPKTLFAK